MFEKQVYISFLLCLIIALFTLKSALVMGYYIFFTEDFIETYCVNKDKPELNCDGKCYLSELLDNNSTENENQQKMMLASSSELVFYFHVGLDEISNSNFTEHTKLFFQIPQLYTFDFLEKKIKPPKDLI